MYPYLPPNILLIPQRNMRRSHFLYNTKALTNISEGMFLLRTEKCGWNLQCFLELA